MDGPRFDRWTRALAARPPSRRAALGGLAAGVAVALLGRDGPAAAACSLPGAACKHDANCCSESCKKKRHKKRGTCRDCSGGSVLCGHTCCPTGMCRGGVCTCPGGGTLCPSPTGGPPVCCAPGDACRNGTCLTPTCNATNAACGRIETVCARPPSGDCECFKTRPSGVACVPDAGCPAASECASAADCAIGQVCVDAGRVGTCGCGDGEPFGVCVTPCLVG